MTIETTAVAVTASGNGATTVWPYSFEIPYADNGVDVAVQVILTDTTVHPNTETILAPSQYTITGVGVNTGGTVIYTPALATGINITIARNVTFTQPYAILNQGFFPHTVEDVADRLVMEIQQVAQDKINSVRAPLVDTNPQMELVSATNRGGKILSFTSAGDVETVIDAGQAEAAIAAFLAGALPITGAPVYALNLAAALALLGALVVPPNGLPMFVGGRSAINDGYQGIFIYDSSDHVTTFPQSGLGFVDNQARRWKRTAKLPLNVQWFGAKGDGATNDFTALQAAYTSLAATGGSIYYPTTGTQYLSGSPITVPYGVYSYGDGLYSTIIRFTAGSGFTAVNENDSWGFHDLTIDVMVNGAVCIDATKLFDGRIVNVRFRNEGGGGVTGTVGIGVNTISATAAAQFTTIAFCMFEALDDPIKLDSTIPGTQYATRFRIIAPTYLNTKNGLNSLVSNGVVSIAATASDITGKMNIHKAASAYMIDIASFMEATPATMYAIDNAANQISLVSPQIVAGTFGLSAGIGTRGFVGGTWGLGISFSGSATPTVKSSIVPDNEAGLVQMGIKSIAKNTDVGANLRGTVTFAGAATAAVAFPNAEVNNGFFVVLSWDTKTETIAWHTKTVNGFTLQSTNATSTAVVDWMIVR